MGLDTISTRGIFMPVLTDRQIQLISAIIKEYAQAAEPVGSVEVVKKYSFRCSPATVRNEMARLINMGYLEMEHTSSGRIPTKLAYKLYLQEILEEVELPVLSEVALKQRLWPTRYEIAKMLREAVIALSDITKNLTIATIDDGFVTYAGAANMLDHREFFQIEAAKTALMVLDNYELLDRVFKKAPFGEDIRFVIGDEIELDKLKRCAFVFTPYEIGTKKGYVSVFGPSRMDYAGIIPALRYTKKLIEELGAS